VPAVLTIPLKVPSIFDTDTGFKNIADTDTDAAIQSIADSDTDADRVD